MVKKTEDLKSTTRPTGRLYLQVALRLLDVMAERSLGPGDRLPGERELASWLGVSRVTIREALLALELAGQTEVRVGDGVYVGHKKLNSDPDLPAAVDPRELLEARRMFEPAVVRNATRVADDRSLGLLTENVDRIDSLVDNYKHIEEFLACGLEFHRMVANLSKNRVAAQSVSAMLDVANHPLWILANRATMAERPIRKLYAADHRQILEAIVSRDAETAAELMLQHMVNMESRFFPATDEEW